MRVDGLHGDLLLLLDLHLHDLALRLLLALLLRHHLLVGRHVCLQRGQHLLLPDLVGLDVVLGVDLALLARLLVEPVVLGHGVVVLVPDGGALRLGLLGRLVVQRRRLPVYQRLDLGAHVAHVDALRHVLLQPQRAPLAGLLLQVEDLGAVLLHDLHVDVLQPPLRLGVELHQALLLVLRLQHLGIDPGHLGLQRLDDLLLVGEGAGDEQVQQREPILVVGEPGTGRQRQRGQPVVAAAGAPEERGRVGEGVEHRRLQRPRQQEGRTVPRPHFVPPEIRPNSCLCLF
mmetsp:Transcript_39540/g.70683  ORF Transcript_39540/g.70683 Transcript_39540/m.70683 type:complete len:287 (-) Transcript_39540:537-1397(-)